jgi:hypothetical protein
MPSSKKHRSIKFKDPIYGFSYDLLIEPDIDKATTFLDYLVQDGDGGRFVVDDDDYKTIRLWFREWDIATFGHEASHAVDHAMEYCGVDDDEARAYYMGFMMKNIYELAE